MNEIICFLKFGEKEHMQGLARGEMFFSNALKYRQIEEELFIKGQGDKLEGGSLFHAQDIMMLDEQLSGIVSLGIGGDIFVRYENVALLPTYCLFACYEKDCTLNSGGEIEFHFSEEIKNNIREHFPKANAAAIIDKPIQFISDVKSSLTTECVSDVINYFNLYGIDSKQGKTIDFEYIKYLTQDNPPQKVGNRTSYTFSEKYVYRALLCKDIFFKNEQEYRIILPKEKIQEGKIYKVNIENDISVVDLEDLFNGNRR